MFHLVFLLAFSISLLLSNSAAGFSSHNVSMTAVSPPPPTSGSGINVSANGRFLVRRDGTPFFWLGDSAQALLYRLSREETDLYLENRANLGFTVIETQIVSFLGINATNFYGDSPFLDSDPTRPNEPFWQHVDYVVNKAASLGLIIALVPDRNLIIDNHSSTSGPLNLTTAFSYGEYVGRRFRGKPIIWILGWDVHPLGRESVYQAEADGIAEGSANGDHNRVMISFHPAAVFAQSDIGSSSGWFHNHYWLDFNSIQSGHKDDAHAFGVPENYTLVMTDYRMFPAKPTLDGEPAYENTLDGFGSTNGPRMSADVIRRKAYWALFAGAFGHTFGNVDIVTFHEPGQPTYAGENTYWKAALDSPGAKQMRHVRTLMESRSALIRIPDQSIVTSDLGTGRSHVRATRASDGSYALVYIPDGRAVTVDTSKISGTVQASWFDPRNGVFIAIGQFANSGTQSFDAPGATQTGNDWVLVLDSLGPTTLAPAPPASSATAPRA